MSSNVFMNNQLERIADYIDDGKAGGGTLTVNLSGVGDMTGATAGQAGTHGLVPAPAAGDQDKTLHGDGTWRADTAELPQVFGSSSGSIITLIDAANYAASDLVIDIDPVQSGSGDPSPDNIRPISGWTGCNVVVSPTTDAEDGTTYSIPFPSEAGTVYGGTLDVTNGTLTVDRAMVTLDGDDIDSISTSSYGIQTAKIPASSVPGIKRGEQLVSNMYVYSTSGSVNNAVRNVNSIMYIYDNRFTDLTTAQGIMNAINVQVIYFLETPITYHRRRGWNNLLHPLPFRSRHSLWRNVGCDEWDADGG